ncbi:MAG: porin family protein [Lewinella sp.]
MASTNFRHRKYLYRYPLALTLFLALFSCSFVQAQFTGGKNYNFYDFQGKPYYFGITLGFNSSRYTPYRSNDFIYVDSIVGVESLNGPGFNLNLIGNLKLGKYFDFRFTPGFSFAERTLNYTQSTVNRRELQEKIESVFIEIPFSFRYKSAPYRDKRLFLIAGMKYSYDVATESRTRQAEELVRISPHDYSIEYGAGVQIFFPYFILSPEFKISHGIGNSLLFNPTLAQSRVLSKVTSRTFTLSFHIEG